jgi:hypothetical protein
MGAVNVVNRLRRDFQATDGEHIPLSHPLPLLAERARKTRHHLNCAACHRPARPGDRVCDLVPGGATVHAPCAARATGGQP